MITYSDFFMFCTLSIGGSNPTRFSRAARPQYCAKHLENINGYSLRCFSCLGTLPLRENCFAPLGEAFLSILGAEDAALLTQGKEDKAKSGEKGRRGADWDRFPYALSSA